MTPMQRLLMALITVALGLLALVLINGSPVAKDAAQNVRMAVNLAHQGTISLEPEAPYTPSMYREPLPIVVGAAVVAVTDHLLGAAPATDYASGARVKILKYQNVLWLLMIWAGTCAAAWSFTRSSAWSVLAGLVSLLPFIPPTSIISVNNLYTELPGTAWLVLATLSLMSAMLDRTAWKFALSGFCFALLVLTKASFLYVFVALCIALALTFLRQPADARGKAACAGAFVATFVLCLTPWIYRNVHTFGQAQISERGGLAVYTRALMNDMTSTEYDGSFYAWARPSLQPWLGSVLGFVPGDLERDGRLERLNPALVSELGDAENPADAVSFYRQGRALRSSLQTEFENAQAPYPDVAADKALAVRGTTMLEHAPLRDLEVAIPLLWRSAAVLFPALLLLFGIALSWRDDVLTLYTVPAIAYLSFYALLTPFEPRPAVIVRALAVVATVTVAHAAWLRLRRGHRIR